MVYVSSACVRHKTIKESVLELCREGLNNIELSGGTQPYDQLENDLLFLKAQKGINFLVHNYFPPPLTPFVLNLASLNEEVAMLSTQHVIRALRLSKKLGAKHYGFHAGFLLDIPVNDIGQKVSRVNLFAREEAIQVFIKNYKAILAIADELDITIYIENNVLSYDNYQTYAPNNPFLLTDVASYQELKFYIDFNLLLDVAHLKVSCNSLHLDFANQLQELWSVANYIHISDNDAQADTNDELRETSTLFDLLKSLSTKDKFFTLEVYGGVEKVLRTKRLIEQLL